MLLELSIENLGVIESERLIFNDGFTAVTGETGAGKTMIVEAINLVVGRRADAAVVRDGAAEATVEARFIAQVDGVETEMVLCRVVEAAGRSRAYINGRMSTVSALAEAGSALVDIHGQHAHQQLLSAAAQRRALDVFAGVDVSPIEEIRRELTEIDALLAALGGDEKSRAREIDLLRFQCSEIGAARIESPDEDAHLEAEEDLLADVLKHKESMWEAVGLLSSDSGASDLLSRAVRAAATVPSLGDVRVRLEAALVEISDVAAEIHAAVESLEEDPGRLEEVRSRRRSLRELMKKYGDSLDEVVAFGADARTRLDELEGYADRVKELESVRAEAMARLDKERIAVGRVRRDAAAGFCAAVQTRLGAVGLANAVLTISFGDPAEDPAGDTAVFLFAANPGLSPQPLSKVASGGELARVMLALRLVLTEDPATMVFDEVDAGIGGSAAVAVAQALRELGDRHQVLAVTHLAQVAAAAHHHVAVEKAIVGGRTFGNAVGVDGEDRVVEVARMLSGGVADDSAVAHARDLLKSLNVGIRARRKG